jgi:O-antigen/teichoic acid export membrane protein
MDKNSLTFQAFKNISYNSIGYVVQVIFALSITPFVVNSLGIKEYGIYLFVTSIISLLGVLDIGTGAAVSKYMAYYIGKKDSVSVNRLAHTANSLFMIMSILGLVILSVVILFSHNIIPLKYVQYSNLFALAGGIFTFNTIAATANSTLLANQRFGIINLLSFVSLTVTSLGTLLIVVFHGTLFDIFLLQFIISIVSFIFTYKIASHLSPEIKYGLALDKTELKKCISFGLANTLNNIARTSLNTLDRMIIPFFVGPSMLTYYSLPGSIASRIPGISGILTMSVFPTVSQLSGSGDNVRINSLYVRSLRLIIIVSGALTITTISFAYYVMYYWLGPVFAINSANILRIFAVANFIISLYTTLSNFLMGMGKMKILSTSSFIMAGVNILALLIFLPKFGILGAAIAYVISFIPVIFVLDYVEIKYLKLFRRKTHHLKTFIGTVITSVLVWLINLLMINYIVNLPTVLIAGGVSVIIYVILYRLLGFFEHEDWRDIENYIFNIIHKLSKPFKK